ncbi:MAG: hypothetical protein AAB455_00250 [Patescibacteria group bacterium]
MVTAPRKLWFKAKRYGWGWTPASAEGWLGLAIYLVVLIKIFWKIDANSGYENGALIILNPPFIIATGILLLVCYLTGEPPRWRWGGKN